MTEVISGLWTQESSDAELIASVRLGASPAYGILFERHAGAARRVAAMYSAVPGDVDDIVSESFARVLKVLQSGGGPDLAFRAYLFTVVRRTGLDLIKKAKRVRPNDDMENYENSMDHSPASDEPTLSEFENSIIADAFRSLPERWQVVLWYTEIEKKTPAEVAPLLGLSPNGVAALAYRAREALRQAYLRQHLATTDNVDCLAVSDELAAFVRGSLTKRDRSRVDRHLRNCSRCQTVVAELHDVNRGLHSVIAPLVLGVVGLGALQGSLPIGGVAVTHAVAAATGWSGVSIGASGAGTGATGAASGVATGVGSTLAHVGSAISSAIASAIGSGGSALAVVATSLGIAAIAVAGAGLAGGLSTYDGSQENTTVIPGDSPAIYPVVPGATPVATDPGSDGASDPGEATTPATEPLQPDSVPAPDPWAATGDVAVVSGGIDVTVGAGGRITIDPASAALDFVITNTGQGANPGVVVVVTLPADLEFVATTDGTGNATLVSGEWSCDVSSALTEATCGAGNFTPKAEKSLVLPVSITGTLSATAMTIVSVTSGKTEPATAEIPTRVKP